MISAANRLRLETLAQLERIRAEHPGLAAK